MNKKIYQLLFIFINAFFFWFKIKYGADIYKTVNTYFKCLPETAPKPAGKYQFQYTSSDAPILIWRYLRKWSLSISLILHTFRWNPQMFIMILKPFTSSYSSLKASISKLSTSRQTKKEQHIYLFGFHYLISPPFFHTNFELSPFHLITVGLVSPIHFKSQFHYTLFITAWTAFW